MSVRENSANSLSLAEVLERLAALETRVAGIIRNRRGEEPIQRACYSIREFCTAHGITSRRSNEITRNSSPSTPTNTRDRDSCRPRRRLLTT